MSKASTRYKQSQIGKKQTQPSRTQPEQEKKPEMETEPVVPTKQRKKINWEYKWRKNKGKVKAGLITAAILAFLVFACAGGFQWLFRARGKLDLCDLSKIKVEEGTGELSDIDLEQQIYSMREEDAIIEDIDKDTPLENGNIVNVDFVGTLNSTGEAFDGGSAEGQEIELGSGVYIEGFEAGILGHRIGETVDVPVTFPEDYGIDELNGQPVTFRITINSAYNKTVPELTDEWAKQCALKKFNKEIKTADEFQKFVKEKYDHILLNNLIYDYLDKHSEAKSYDSILMERAKTYTQGNLTMYANNAGMSEEDYAAYCGYTSAEDYVEATAKDLLKRYMITEAICKKNNVKLSQEKIDQLTWEYLGDQGVKEDYETLKDFREEAGENFLWLLENLEFRYHAAMDTLHDNVVYVSAEEMAEEETNTEPESTAESENGETESESMTEEEDKTEPEGTTDVSSSAEK